MTFKRITLTNLAESTRQEVFDWVANHLLTQRKQSVVAGTCMYHHDNLSCAAGCLITDQEYRSTFEGRAWDVLVALHEVPEIHSSLIQRLQVIHDRSSSELWEELLQLQAKSSNLEWKFQ